MSATLRVSSWCITAPESHLYFLDIDSDPSSSLFSVRVLGKSSRISCEPTYVWRYGGLEGWVHQWTLTPYPLLQHISAKYIRFGFPKFNRI